MADKFHSDTQERIESILYNPGLKDSGDLEAGTHTIVPTSQPAIGSAQYSKSLSLPKPDDARLEIKRIAARLSVNITDLGTATHVYLSVRVDVDDADHELFSQDWTSTGAKLAAVDIHSENKATIFNLLKDGAAHTFYFLFWADAASQATIDVVQLWEAVGSIATGWGAVALELTHTGFMDFAARIQAQGSGTAKPKVVDTTDTAKQLFQDTGAADKHISTDKPFLVPGSIYFRMATTVATDIAYIAEILFYLRSEQ